MSQVIIANAIPTSSDTSKIVGGTSKPEHTKMPTNRHALYVNLTDEYDTIWCIDDPKLILPIGWYSARLSEDHSSMICGKIHELRCSNISTSSHSRKASS